MKSGSVKHIFATAVLGLALATDAQAGTTVDPYDGGWHILVTPYLWAPRIDGTLNFTTGSGTKPTVSITPINYLEHLNVPLMISGEVRKRKWAAATDVVFVDFSGGKAQVKSVGGPGGRLEIPIDAGSQVGLRGTIWTLGGSCTVWRAEIVTLDVLAGFRYFRVKSSLDWQISGGIGLLPPSGSFSEAANIWNGIAGIRGRVQFGRHRWFAPYYLDVGTGSSDFTWQGMGGIAYGFGWADVMLTYRDLLFDAGESSLLGRLRLTGPGLGVAIRF